MFAGYYNLRMVLNAVFLTIDETNETNDLATVAAVQESRQRCTESAGRAISLMYDTFSNDNFFQTW